MSKKPQKQIDKALRSVSKLCGLRNYDHITMDEWCTAASISSQLRDLRKTIVDRKIAEYTKSTKFRKHPK